MTDPLSGLVIALASVGLGALTWLWQRRRTQRDEDHEGERRLLRMLVALHAELAVAVRGHRKFFGSKLVETYRTTMLETLSTSQDEDETHSMPSGAVSPGNIVFDSLRGELARLPADTLEPVIEYYLAAESVAEMMRAFYERRYETLRLSRREKAIDAFFELGKVAFEKAVIAERVLDTSIENQRNRMKDLSVPYEIVRSSRADSDDNDGGTEKHG